MNTRKLLTYWKDHKHKSTWTRSISEPPGYARKFYIFIEFLWLKKKKESKDISGRRHYLTYSGEPERNATTMSQCFCNFSRIFKRKESKMLLASENILFSIFLEFYFP